MMSGRRIRQVNAKKKIEEWKAEEEERKLEKVAEEYTKKMNSKKMMVNKGKGNSYAVDEYFSGSCIESSNKEKPLMNFDDGINSAAELEVLLGMDGLKSELQARELKCGGNLQQRATRLFLLKTKLFAKK
ncbi:OLC1v1019781C1 [Oldenlandia corymbosa var. corymbosa]|uniref:OLC1v1019781C1 n=1 Tax=Oldenlandia corymbosa var. corymbosa TaxID=529605 RepID=A0AAV1EF15_OLDCO|nr:OLC1v1019781C1 [Oldenlandia corymbosa var. corymbosa]